MESSGTKPLSARIGEVVRRLQTVRRDVVGDVPLPALGEVLFEVLFEGDVERLACRGGLAAEVAVQLEAFGSRSKLERALAFQAVRLAVGERAELVGLKPGHYAAVDKLEPRRQLQLLRAAAESGWKVQQLVDRAADARCGGGGGGAAESPCRPRPGNWERRSARSGRRCASCAAVRTSARICTTAWSRFAGSSRSSGTCQSPARSPSERGTLLKLSACVDETTEAPGPPSSGKALA